MPTAAVATHDASGGGATVSDRERVTPLTVGVVVWLISELMFFGGLFAAWFVLRANNEPNWPPPGEEIEPLRMAIGTVILVTSSLMIELSVRSTERGRRQAALAFLVMTAVLASAFLLNEGIEWASLDFGFSASAFSTIFYLLTGFHGAHVLTGVVIMAVVGWVVFSPGSSAPRAESMRAVAYYWHFVDIVWVVLFLVVYVLR